MDSLIKRLKEDIQRKEELSGISENILEESINKYLKKNRINPNDSIKEKDIKFLVKEIRDDLRLMHGRFQVSLKQRKKAIKSKDYDSMLASHRSTLERKGIYEEVKELIIKLNPTSIIDIACGLNPLAIAKAGQEYLAIDINQKEIELINSFFTEEGINGKAICQDARKIEYDKMKKYDLCLMFKFLDFIEDSHKNADFFLKNVNCENFLISFATKSISGKSARQTRRVWLERIVKKLEYSYNIVEFENEIFYLVKKQ